MKKTFFIFIIVFILAFTPSFIPVYSVNAKSAYLRVITEDTPFYKSLDDSLPLFYLPYTYYVKAINDVGEYTHVEIYDSTSQIALDGYVPKNLLFDDGLAVSSPYLSLKITTADTTVLYKDSSLTTPLQYVFPDRKMDYYGKLTMATENVYYVSYNNRLGYVKESSVVPFLIQNHPNELTFIVPEEPPETQPDTPSVTEDFFGLKIIIIVCLVFAGIIALFFALGKRPSKSYTATGYYDENDYE